MRTLTLFALIALSSLSAFAAPKPSTPRPPCRRMTLEDDSKVWARPTKGGSSTSSCELTVSLRLTNSVKKPTLKSKVTDTHCTVLVPEDVRGGDLVLKAFDLCVDAAHAEAERLVKP